MSQAFLSNYAEAAMTTLGLFWMALWAFILGYVVSSMIQVFVTQARMKKAMGSTDSKGVLLGTFFGFISSSCSFSALATTKSLIKKGAGFVPSMAFLLASTNLVIELGIVISIFLTWHFVVGEYIGGLLLIGSAWAIIKLTPHKKLVEQVRERLGDDKQESDKVPSWKKRILSAEAWKETAQQYFMEWQMVWKDVTVGFTVAGIIAVFVPSSFFETLFISTGQGQSEFELLTLLEHVIVGPVAAFCTFIGSMGNIPLASLLYANGVSFAGVMAFIFSDLVVFPVLRINAKYYGWKMSLYMLFILFCSLVIVSLALHYGFWSLDLLPESGKINLVDRDHFNIDYTFYLNLLFLAISGLFAYITFSKKSSHDHSSSHDHHKMSKGITEKVLKVLAIASFIWLMGGVLIHFLI